MFYTDEWDAFVKVLPSERHIIGKSGTTCIEQDNSNTRHHLARFTRRTKVVSKKVNMVYDSIKLWAHVNQEAVFSSLQEKFLPLFRGIFCT
jgi:IS1 family transposase